MASEDLLNKLNNQIKRQFKNAVCGSGKAPSTIMLIGEAPNLEEVKQSKPFVGKAGKFLWTELEKIGLKRPQIYVTNAIKYQIDRPSAKHIDLCLPYLEQEIQIIKPKTIIALGKTALKALKKTKVSGIKIIASPHPSAAMRFPKQKTLFKLGLKLIKGIKNA